MRYGHRSARLYLFLEERYYRTVASEDISEAHCSILCMRADAFFFRCRALLCGGSQLNDFGVLTLLVHMCVELREHIHSVVLADDVHALNDHLTESLAGPHYIGRVDCLVRAYEHESVRAVLHRGVCSLICTYYIVLDCLVRAVLHERDMLMCRRMVDYLRPVLREHALYPSAVPYGADEHLEVELWVVLSKLLLDIVCVVLIYIEDNELLRMMLGHLSAQLASYGAAAACYEDDLALYEGVYLTHIHPYLVTSEKICHFNFLHLA